MLDGLKQGIGRLDRVRILGLALAAAITATASYSEFRRFATAGRLIPAP